MKWIKITSFLILSVVLIWGTEWRIPVRFHPTSLDTYYHYTYYFGERDGATDNYDPFIDLAIPIQPPEGFFPYFVGDTTGDTVMPYLREDYRSSVDTGVGHIDYLWQLSFRDDPGESVWVIWDADSFPYIPEYPIYMHFIASETPPDSENWLSATPITEQESVYIPVEQSVFFKYWDRTGIEDFQEKPEEIEIVSYPNPFNSSCIITISDSRDLMHRTPTNIEIYDIRGNIVATSLPHRDMGSEQGKQWIYVWKPSEKVSSGIYFVRVIGETNSFISTKRIIYIK